MRKSTFTAEYDLLRARLVALRRAANLSQRDLAKRLGRERSFIGRVETGDRRVDLLELYWLCEACGADAAKVTTSLIKAFRGLGGGEARRAAKRR